MLMNYDDPNKDRNKTITVKIICIHSLFEKKKMKKKRFSQLWRHFTKKKK